MTRRSFSANVAFTLIASVAPALAAAVALPNLYVLLGAERLGVLTLAWAAIGAFALLDVGLGRALTHETSRLLALGRAADIRPLARATLGLLTGLGVVAGAALAFGAEAIVARLDRPAALATEIEQTLLVCALAVPLMTASAGLRGVIEAHGRFDLTSAVRVGLGVLTYLGPWLAVVVTQSLAFAVGVIVAGRFATTALLYGFMESTLVRGQAGTPAAAWLLVKQTLANGLWMTLAGIAGALLTVVDRFILGASASLAAIAYYSTPQELIGKLTLVPMALSAVLFPQLSAAAAHGTDGLDRLFMRGMRYTFALLIPPLAVGAAVAHEWLGVWLGAEFSAASTHVVQWLCLAVLLQSLAVTPLNLLQAIGRADATAWLQLVQLPLFAAAVWFAVSVAGIDGAAFVWALRMLIDLLLLLMLSHRYAPELRPTLVFWAQALVATTAWFVVLMQLDALLLRAAALAVAALAFMVFLPRLIGHDDLQQMRALLGRLTGGRRA